MTYAEYEVHMDYLPEDAVCKCESCEWTGEQDEAFVIGIAVLTPGDPSPAGRCPRCDALVYPMFEMPVNCTEIIDQLKDAAIVAMRNKDTPMFALLDKAAGALQALLE